MFEFFNKNSKKKDKYEPPTIHPGQPAPGKDSKKDGSGKIHMITASRDDQVSEEIKKYISQQIQDPFKDNYSSSSDPADFTPLLSPYYLPQSLNSLVNTNAMLKQCVKATVDNVAGNGFYLKYIGPKEDKDKEEVLDKKKSYHDLLHRPNPETDGTTMFLATTEDYVRTGYAYLEVARVPKTNKVGYIYHVPSSTVRKSRKETDATSVEEYIIRDGNEIKVPYKRNFRVYGMRAETGAETVYFKEFKDPNTRSKLTGKKASKRLKRSEVANELIAIENYEPNHVYSLPLWINQLPAILGSRLSEEVNLDFFENNAIPAMLLMVSGGALTPDTIDDLQRKFDSIKGTNSVQKILIVEATGDDSAVQMGGSIPPPKLEAVPMTARQNDSLFREYNQDNKDSIQCSFRLSDVHLGKTSEFNRATAYASIMLAEAQVFSPIRRIIESVINRCIIVDGKGMPDEHWEFVLKPTKLLNDETVFNALDKGIKSGAATPKDVADIIRDNFNIDIPVDDKEWYNNIPSAGIEQGMKIMYETLASAGKVLDINMPESSIMEVQLPEQVEFDPED